MSDPKGLTQNLDVKVDKLMDKRMNRVTDKQTNEWNDKNYTSHDILYMLGV